VLRRKLRNRRRRQPPTPPRRFVRLRHDRMQFVRLCELRQCGHAKRARAEEDEVELIARCC
jgi:hypothetical protein